MSYGQLPVNVLGVYNVRAVNFVPHTMWKGWSFFSFFLGAHHVDVAF